MVRVRLVNEILGFSSAHITKIGEQWKLHGHNFRVQVVLDVPDLKCGELGYFERIRQELKVLDHKVVIPTNRIVHKDSHQVHVNYEGSLFTFPIEDCHFIERKSASLQDLLELVEEILGSFSLEMIALSTDGLTWIEKRIKGLSA